MVNYPFSLPAQRLALSIFALVILMLAAACRRAAPNPIAPPEYQTGGAFVGNLPYHNPDSCAMLIRREVPQQWQGTAYESLFLDVPEDVPVELNFKHLDCYEKNFPADTATAFAQMWRGNLYAQVGKLDSAKMCLSAAAEISERLGQPLRISDVQDAVANIHFQEGNTAEALQAFLASYEAIKNLDSTHNERKQDAMANISSIYLQSNNARMALDWLQRSLPLVSHPGYAVDNYQRLSSIYCNLNLADSALLTAQKAWDLHTKHQTSNNGSLLLSSLAQAYLAKGDCRTAANLELKALREMEGNSLLVKSSLEKHLANAYSCLGKMDSAEYFYKQVLQSPAALNVSLANTRLSEIYAKRGQYKAAYEGLFASWQTEKKTYSIEKIQAVGAAVAELKLKEKHLLAAQAEQQHKISKQQLWIGLLLLALGLGFTLSLFLRQRARRRIAEQEKNLLAQEKELAEAYAQLTAQELARSKTDLQQTKEELETTARALALKNQLLEELEMRFNENRATDSDDNIPDKSTETTHLRSMKILTDQDWARFRERFEEAFPQFLAKLRSRFPELSAAETRLFLLIKLKFSTQEAAETLGISPESVWRSRSRLSQKLSLVGTGELDSFVRDFA